MKDHFLKVIPKSHHFRARNQIIEKGSLNHNMLGRLKQFLLKTLEHTLICLKTMRWLFTESFSQIHSFWVR